MRFVATGILAFTVMVTSVVAADAPIAKIALPELTKSQWQEVQRLGLDYDICGGHHDLFATPEQIAELRAFGIGIEVEIEDLTAYYQSRNTAGLTFGGFKTLAEIETYLDSLSNAFPNLCSQKFSIGTTIEGRNMWVVKISDNHATDEAEPEVFYNSLIHAREPAAGAALLHFMTYLLTNYGTNQEVTDVVNERELFFLPVFNPDGYAYNEFTSPEGGGMWRKNRRNNGSSTGVDLNRNWGYGWAQDNVGSSANSNSETYRGTAPFSEPETQNVRNFVLGRNFVIAHNIHCYSNLFLWPWGGADRMYTPQDVFYSEVGDSLAKDNLYSPMVGWGLYPTNGASDEWFWGDTVGKPRVISFTTEIGGPGDGFWPAPSRIPELVDENIWPNLYLAKIAGDPFILDAPNAPQMNVVDTGSEDYSVVWSHDDLINPAVTYSLFELTGKSTVSENFEGTTSPHWDVIRFARSNVRAHTGTYSWRTSNTNSANHWLVGKRPYLVQMNDSLVFWTWYAVENNYDYLYVQLSVDGGHEFVSLASTITTNVDPNNVNLGNGITGNSGGWVRAAFDLSSYVGQEVIFRLYFATDGGSLGEGVYIDDFENIDFFAGEVTLASATAETTYAFVDKPAGEYWYRVLATDAQGQQSLKSFAVHTHVPVPYVLGDFDGDTLVDIGDLTALISYIFLEGPAPVPEARMNVDCTGAIDISDLTLLIDHLFINLAEMECP